MMRFELNLSQQRRVACRLAAHILSKIVPPKIDPQCWRESPSAGWNKNDISRQSLRQAGAVQTCQGGNQYV
jgi:hypothetical protein